MTASRTTKNAQAVHRRDRLIMWTALGLGLFLFVSSLVGNLAGFIVLPFDPHHMYGQIGGIVLVVFGLTRWR